MSTNDTSSTLIRAFRILEAVTDAERPISVAELVEQLDLPKPTAHRLAQRLINEGLLQREPVGKRLSPGFRLGRLALGVLASSALLAPRRAILKRLSETLRETCNISVLNGDQLLYLDRVESNWPIRVQLPIGSSLPLHCTASGKLLLASLGQRQRATLIRSLTLSANTPKTLTDPERLEQALQTIAETGISTDDEELFSGMVAVAVPIFDDSGKTCATVAVHAPTVRRSLDTLLEQLPELRRAADALGELFRNGTPKADDGVR